MVGPALPLRPTRYPGWTRSPHIQRGNSFNSYYCISLSALGGRRTQAVLERAVGVGGLTGGWSIATHTCIMLAEIRGRPVAMRAVPPLCFSGRALVDRAPRLDRSNWGPCRSAGVA